MNALASVGPDRILDLTYAFRRARLLAAAVEFAIFTVLGREGPLGVAALAARCGLHARAARDALDALVALGLLLRDDRGLYANGPDAARWLDEGSSDCIAALVRMVDGNERQTWSRLTEALRTGDRQVTSNGPGSGFTALLADPVRLARFAAGNHIRIQQWLLCAQVAGQKRHAPPIATWRSAIAGLRNHEQARIRTNGTGHGVSPGGRLGQR